MKVEVMQSAETLHLNESYQVVKDVSLAISRCELSWSDFVACSIHYHFHRVTPGKLYATLEGADVPLRSFIPQR